jgi:hypothetical protein
VVTEELILRARWTDDCQGKKDYDAPIVVISTRYWPRGGGFDLLNVENGRVVSWEGNEARPDVKPSAKSSLGIRHGAADPDEENLDADADFFTLTEAEFEAETEEEVKAMVEKWAQEQMDKVVGILRAAFGK